jgi:hypothetical protein
VLISGRHLYSGDHVADGGLAYIKEAVEGNSIESSAPGREVRPAAGEVAPMKFQEDADSREADGKKVEVEASKSEAGTLELRIESSNFGVESSNFEVESSDFEVESSNFEAESSNFEAVPGLSQPESAESEVIPPKRQPVRPKCDVSSLGSEVRAEDCLVDH